MEKGYYLTLDIAMAVALSVIVISILMATMASQPASNMGGVASQRLAESALYVMEANGGLDDIVRFLDIGNAAQANRRTAKLLTDMQLGFGAVLRIRAFDANMALVHDFQASAGPMAEQHYSASIAFAPRQATSKYAIATLYVGG